MMKKNNAITCDFMDCHNCAYENKNYPHNDSVQCKKVRDLWEEFGDVPMDTETECIEEEWHDFPVGTFREDIWHWFEETFNVSVAALMYEI